mmetsp:Transcript_86826/g.185991  ORF Transcript_86826/g.185991 Transcript_86826/m.185991 type:complete len:254 (-) Transcript_86826:107-868(-)
MAAHNDGTSVRQTTPRDTPRQGGMDRQPLIDPRLPVGDIDQKAALAGGGAMCDRMPGICYTNRFEVAKQSGQGSWVAETTYRYVGQGKGNCEWVEMPPDPATKKEVPPPSWRQYFRSLCNIHNCYFQAGLMFFGILGSLLLYSWWTAYTEPSDSDALNKTVAEASSHSGATLASVVAAAAPAKPTVPAKAGLLAKAAAPVTTAVPTGTASGERYDCMKMYFQWRTHWSDAKKTWCCAHLKLGCEDSLATVIGQ